MVVDKEHYFDLMLAMFVFIQGKKETSIHSYNSKTESKYSEFRLMTHSLEESIEVVTFYRVANTSYAPKLSLTILA